MPRTKKARNRFSVWQHVGADVLRLNRDTLDGNELAAVLAVAVAPAALPESVANPEAGELARLFAVAYARHPALVLRLLESIRERCANDSHRGIAQRWLATHAWCDRKRGLTATKATDGEIAQAIERDFSKDVSTETVRKARQAMKPVADLWISEPLAAALREIRARGIDVGWGC
jgi:hypothetical protein